MIHVLLVDDSASVREVTAAALHAVDPELLVYAVGDARMARHVLRWGKPIRPDVVLLDLRIESTGHHPDGLALLPFIRVPVVLFTCVDDLPATTAARCAGYVLKGTPAPEIAAVIRRAITKPA